MSKFKVQASPKPRVDDQALAAFSAGADTHSAEPPVLPQPLASSALSPAPRSEKATETFLIRLTPSQMELLNLVFEQTNVKSKQKLVEGILIPELKRRAADLRK